MSTTPTWIPTSERLPQDGQRVKFKNAIVEAKGVFKSRPYGSALFWFFIDPEREIAVSMESVTHWMPREDVPAPPSANTGTAAPVSRCCGAKTEPVFSGTPPFGTSRTAFCTACGKACEERGADKSAGDGFYGGIEWFACWLLDHAEGETISEEQLRPWAVQAWREHLKPATPPASGTQEGVTPEAKQLPFPPLPNLDAPTPAPTAEELAKWIEAEGRSYTLRYPHSNWPGIKYCHDIAAELRRLAEVNTALKNCETLLIKKWRDKLTAAERERDTGHEMRVASESDYNNLRALLRGEEATPCNAHVVEHAAEVWAWKMEVLAAATNKALQLEADLAAMTRQRDTYHERAKFWEIETGVKTALVEKLRGLITRALELNKEATPHLNTQQEVLREALALTDTKGEK